MSNVLYPKAKESFLNGEIDLLTDTIKVRLLSAGYTPNFDVDEFLSDVPAGIGVGTDQTLSNPDTTAGVFDADPPTWTTLSGDEVVSAIMYKSTGADLSSRLIAFFNQGTGLPYTPIGANVTMYWSNEDSKIFAL